MSLENILILAFFVFLALRLLVAFVNLITSSVFNGRSTDFKETVDVLIPARNEENTIGGLLSDLETQTFDKMQVWVYNDNSEDKTDIVVQSFVDKNKNFHLLQGVELPKGWSGKNHACDQLSKHSDADTMIFLDADVRISNDFISKAANYLHSNKLQLLSLFPVQRMVTFGEQLIVSMINWILVSLLPLKLVSYSSWVSFSAANGQCMVFNGETYRKFRWHSLVRNKVVEDIKIARVMKQQGEKIAVLLGSNDITCRMYTSFGDSVRGVARSSPAFFGNSIFFAFLFILLTVILPVFVFIYGGLLLSLLLITGSIVLRIIVAALSKQPVLLAIALHLVQVILLPVVIFRGFYMLYNRSYVWKNRKINLS